MKEAVGSSNWDIRDVTCSAIDAILDKHPSLSECNSQIWRDLEEMILQLMNDTNHYVLSSVIKVLPKFYEANKSLMGISNISSFLEHCSTFCEDSIHSQLTSLFKSHSQFCEILSGDSIMRRTFESDLCR